MSSSPPRGLVPAAGRAQSGSRSPGSLFHAPHSHVIAQVATQNAIDRTFDYAIPEHLADRVRPGVRVKVPFGTRVV